MKKLTNILLVSLMFMTSFMVASPKLAQNNQLDSIMQRVSTGGSTIYGDIKSLYNTDGKDLIKYAGKGMEKGLNRLDSILTKGYRSLSKGAAHVYDVLKTQQLVKSFHHLCYWIFGIILTIIIFRRFSKYQAEPSDIAFYTLLVLTAFDIGLTVYNSYNFMEMWTGFLNPEYGVFMDIIEYTNQTVK